MKQFNKHLFYSNLTYKETDQIKLLNPNNNVSMLAVKRNQLLEIVNLFEKLLFVLGGGAGIITIFSSLIIYLTLQIIF